MYLDISRARFDAKKHYSNVVVLQGRATLDSDSGEQSQILLHYLRTAIRDIIGPAGCPAEASGFAVGSIPDKKQPDLSIAPGRMYVDGILLENSDDGVTYWTQPDGYLDPDLNPFPAGAFLVGVRAYEASVTMLQDPDMREIALGIHGPDTTARTRVVWQVVVYGFDKDPTSKNAADVWREWLQGATEPRAMLKARATQPDGAVFDICSITPRAQYRGRENQHYRVELLRSGEPKPPDAAAGDAVGVAQYVWSRENGSVVFGIDSLEGVEVTLDSLGRDAAFGLEVGDWVEIADDVSSRRIADEASSGMERFVYQVIAIDVLDRIITLDRDPGAEIGTTGAVAALHPLVRRWDGAGSADLVEDEWLDLEDGVQVLFAGSPGAKQPTRYRCGDYWLVPARTVLGDVIWPQDADGPLALAPHGVEYHYAPLAYMPLDRNKPMVDLRVEFQPLAP